jgi:hypothetical protein
MSNCKHCNSLLIGSHSISFCNRSCSASYNNRFKTKHGKYAPKKCAYCGVETKNVKFCSKACGGLGKEKYHTPEQKLHARRMKQREAYARYAAKKKYQTPVGEDLAAIKKFYFNCPIGYEVDHKIPISKGGPHALHNLQYLTISDNRKKGAKLDWCPEGESNAWPTL